MLISSPLLVLRLLIASVICLMLMLLLLLIVRGPSGWITIANG